MRPIPSLACPAFLDSICKQLTFETRYEDKTSSSPVQAHASYARFNGVSSAGHMGLENGCTQQGQRIEGNSLEIAICLFAYLLVCFQLDLIEGGVLN